MSLVPNRKGQPLLVQWQVACRVAGIPGIAGKDAGQGAFTLEPFEAFAQRTGLQAGGLPNPGQTDALAAATQDLQFAGCGARSDCA